MVLDIQEKRKDILPGEHGYIQSQRLKNLRSSLILLLICFVVFLLGKVVFYRVEVIFNLASVLLLLPSAQFFARFFSFLKYKTMDEADYNLLNSISDDFMVLCDLPIIRGKKEHLLKALVITEVGIFGLIEEQKNTTVSQRNCRSMESVLMDILKPKALNKRIEVYSDVIQLRDLLKNSVKSTLKHDNREFLEKVKETILFCIH